jgi:hypothetical protein
MEDLFTDQRIEVAALIANAKVRDVNDADVTRAADRDGWSSPTLSSA